MSPSRGLSGRWTVKNTIFNLSLFCHRRSIEATKHLKHLPLFARLAIFPTTLPCYKLMSWKGNVSLLSFAVLRSEFTREKSEARMQAGWKSRSQYMKTRAFSALRQVSDKYHPFLIELPHPTSIQTLHSVCLAQLNLQLYFPRNKITISAWKSKQIFSFLQRNCIGTLSPSCSPSANQVEMKQEEEFHCTKGEFQAAESNVQQQIQTRRVEAVTSPAIKSKVRDSHPLETKLLSHGNFHCEGELELGPARGQKPWCAGRWDTWHCCPCLETQPSREDRHKAQGTQLLSFF